MLRNVIMFLFFSTLQHALTETLGYFMSHTTLWHSFFWESTNVSSCTWWGHIISFYFLAVVIPALAYAKKKLLLNFSSVWYGIWRKPKDWGWRQKKFRLRRDFLSGACAYLPDINIIVKHNPHNHSFKQGICALPNPSVPFFLQWMCTYYYEPSAQM